MSVRPLPLEVMSVLPDIILSWRGSSHCRSIAGGLYTQALLRLMVTDNTASQPSACIKEICFEELDGLCTLYSFLRGRSHQDITRFYGEGQNMAHFGDGRRSTGNQTFFHQSAGPLAC